MTSPVGSNAQSALFASPPHAGKNASYAQANVFNQALQASPSQDSVVMSSPVKKKPKSLLAELLEKNKTQEASVEPQPETTKTAPSPKDTPPKPKKAYSVADYCKASETDTLRDLETLSPALITAKLREQQAIVDNLDIEEIIAINFPKKDENLALDLLQKMTRFGNMKSLNDLQNKLRHYSKSDPESHIYYEKEGSLGSTLNYLAKKHKDNSGVPSPFTRPALQQGNLNEISKGAILLDAVTLNQIKSSTELQAHIRDKNIPLLYPAGWEEGINPFNQLTIEAVAVKLSALMNTAKELLTQQHLSSDEAINQALSEPTRRALREMSLEGQLKIIEPSVKKPLSDKDKQAEEKLSASEKIARQLAPAELSPATLNEVIKKFSPGHYQQSALEILARQAEVYSPLRLTKSAHEKQLAILKQAKDLGVEPENIYYYISEKGKSFGLVSMHHTLVNQIPSSQIIENVSAIPVPSKSLLVVLDDVAGSGDSLKQIHYNLRNDYSSPDRPQSRQLKLLMAPTISTTRAKEAFQKIHTQDKNCFYLSSRTMSPFTDNSFYKGLPYYLRSVMAKAMGHMGHDENGLSLVFPYMAPDNNHAFFADRIAPHFTLNKAGCKNNHEKHVFPQQNGSEPVTSHTETLSTPDFLAQIAPDFDDFFIAPSGDSAASSLGSKKSSPSCLSPLKSPSPRNKSNNAESFEKRSPKPPTGKFWGGDSSSDSESEISFNLSSSPLENDDLESFDFPEPSTGPWSFR